MNLIKIKKYLILYFAFSTLIFNPVVSSYAKTQKGGIRSFIKNDTKRYIDINYSRSEPITRDSMLILAIADEISGDPNSLPSGIYIKDTYFTLSPNGSNYDLTSTDPILIGSNQVNTINITIDENAVPSTPFSKDVIDDYNKIKFPERDGGELSDYHIGFGIGKYTKFIGGLVLIGTSLDFTVNLKNSIGYTVQHSAFTHLMLGVGVPDHIYFYSKLGLGFARLQSNLQNVSGQSIAPFLDANGTANNNTLDITVNEHNFDVMTTVSSKTKSIEEFSGYKFAVHGEIGVLFEITNSINLYAAIDTMLTFWHEDVSAPFGVKGGIQILF